MTINEAVEEISAMKGLCVLCVELKKEAFQESTQEKIIQFIKDYEGFQCGAIVNMRRIAWGIK